MPWLCQYVIGAVMPSLTEYLIRLQTKDDGTASIHQIEEVVKRFSETKVQLPHPVGHRHPWSFGSVLSILQKRTFTYFLVTSTSTSHQQHGQKFLPNLSTSEDTFSAIQCFRLSHQDLFLLSSAKLTRP